MFFVGTAVPIAKVGTPLGPPGYWFAPWLLANREYPGACVLLLLPITYIPTYAFTGEELGSVEVRSSRIGADENEPLLPWLSIWSRARSVTVPLLLPQLPLGLIGLQM